jgi:S1-C subfamily serine protease
MAPAPAPDSGPAAFATSGAPSPVPMFRPASSAYVGAPKPAAANTASGRPVAAGDRPADRSGAIAAAPRRGLRAFVARHERRLWALALIGIALAWLWTVRQGGPMRMPLTPEQITAVVRKDLQEKPLPSEAAAAYAAIRGSVVRVVGLDSEGDAQGSSGEQSSDSAARNIGTGVVIVENGTILTNLHVVQGAKRLKVTFADGSESDAVMVGAQAENDLAVLRAKTVPDDLKAATLRSTGDLAPGDEVLAVGFPFGIGPSASAGVVSGLKREFRSPDGQQMITNLIQFDAAANPGNSGGPLVTMDGSVVGIVTAILNPSKQRVFIGIGFAVPIENAAAAAGMPPF